MCHIYIPVCFYNWSYSIEYYSNHQSVMWHLDIFFKKREKKGTYKVSAHSKRPSILVPLPQPLHHFHTGHTQRCQLHDHTVTALEQRGASRVLPVLTPSTCTVEESRRPHSWRWRQPPPVTPVSVQPTGWRGGMQHASNICLFLCVKSNTISICYKQCVFFLFVFIVNRNAIHLFS